MSIVDLSQERNKRERPDADHVMVDDFGREMFEFLCSYEMDGEEWSSRVWAYSADDAERRIAAMRESLRCDGQIYTIVSA